MEIKANAIADLHIHTKESDGVYGAGKIISAVSGTKLKTIAFTDHHTTVAYDKAMDKAELHGITLIPGVEVSAKGYKKLHILGYGMTNRTHINELLQENSASSKMRRIAEILDEQNIFLSQDFIDDMIKNGNTNRHKIAQEIAKLRCANSIKDAYNNYVSPDVLPNSQLYKYTAQEIIKLITDAGGVACLAHPKSISHTETDEKLTHYEREELLAKLAGCGLRGIECLPSVRRQKIKSNDYWQSLADNFRLLTVGGTDYHGDKADHQEFIGNPYITQEHIDALLDEIKISNANIEDQTRNG